MHDPIHELERLLTDMLAEHERLEALLQTKLDALRRADAKAVTDCCGRENQIVQKIATLEKRRQAVVAQITQQHNPAAAELMTMAAIAATVDEPRKGRLLTLHAKLRSTAEQTQRTVRVAKQATEGLLNHVQGLMQRIARVVNDGGTYGRAGRVATAAPAMTSSFSITG